MVNVEIKNSERRDVTFDEALIWIALLTLIALFATEIDKFVYAGFAQLILSVIAVSIFLATRGSARKFGFFFSLHSLKWLGIFVLTIGTFYGILLLVAFLTVGSEVIANGYLSTNYVLSMVLFSPIAEEILFRGFLFRALRKHFPFLLALIVSAILFMVMHQVWGNIGLQNLNHFFGGIVFALIYAKTRSIFAAIILHSLGNTALILIGCF
ncbi:MAG: CPBP family intramembrane metalloprotease [Planctomycetes bacterium]|nr:CPBP family intramembrane metalloprotease [Planctomycetota bacterium]